jgi:hypothetical protein
MRLLRGSKEVDNAQNRTFPQAPPPRNAIHLGFVCARYRKSDEQPSDD